MSVQQSQNEIIKKRSSVHARPKIELAPVVDGNFKSYRKTYKELIISRVNKTMCIILGVLILLSVCSYYFITSSEMKLNSIYKETIQINDENIELQNQLDYLKSYNNVDKTMKGKNILQTANHVMEVSSTTAPVENDKKETKDNRSRNQKNVNKKPFSWSLGY